MKKLFLIIFTFITVLNSNAQAYYFETSQFAYKVKYSGYWTDWTDWEDSKLIITINLDTDVIAIYSPSLQVYQITKYIQDYEDEGGGYQKEYAFIDQDLKRGIIRLRKENTGNSQVYVEYDDAMWVYNVKRIR